MIQKTRIKIVAVTMSIITLIFLIIGAVLYADIRAGERAARNTALQNIVNQAAGRGDMPPSPVDNRGMSRSFFVVADSGGNVIRYAYDSSFFDEEAMTEYANRFFSKGSSGNEGSLYYTVAERGGLIIVAATDRSIEDGITKDWILRYSIYTGAGLIALFIIVWFLSLWIIKPLKEAIQKQKQFISDAGHELKTPVTIISANAEVLETKTGGSKWLENIKSQTVRMSALANDLFALAKLDEEQKPAKKDFCLSETIINCVLPFESVIYENGKTIETNIMPSINYCGDAVFASKAVNILLENAVKYSDKNGTIRVGLSAQNGKPVLEVFNTGAGIKEEERERIFERFYRGDSSRARETGGSGLGLSILKGIAGNNNWKLAVRGEEGKNIAFFIYF